MRAKEVSLRLTMIGACTRPCGYRQLFGRGFPIGEDVVPYFEDPQAVDIVPYFEAPWTYRLGLLSYSFFIRRATRIDADSLLSSSESKASM